MYIFGSKKYFYGKIRVHRNIRILLKKKPMRNRAEKPNLIWAICALKPEGSMLKNNKMMISKVLRKRPTGCTNLQPKSISKSTTLEQDGETE